MKSIQVLLLYLLTIGFACEARSQGSRIDIVRPTIQQEATSIWRTINDYTFLENQGYRIHLPDDAIIDSLIIKSKHGAFGNEDFSTIYALLDTTFFDPEDYEQAHQKVADELALLNEFVAEIDAKKDQWDWTFKMFDQYKVVFTLYGTGGSYDPDEGIVTLLTNKEGGFMKYSNPAYTIIHEITHMGMEYSIVQHYNLPHGLKERIIDTFVSLMFGEELPDYTIQAMGEEEIDTYLNKEKDIESLNAIIADLMNE